MIEAGRSRSSSAHHWQCLDAIQQQTGRLAVILIVIEDSLPDLSILAGNRRHPLTRTS